MVRSLASAQPIDAEPRHSRQPERVMQRAPERSTDRVEERRLSRPSQSWLTSDGQFSLDMAAVPKGFVMEWKRHTLLGQQDTKNQVTIRQYHWEPVPHKMQPHILGHLCKNDDEHIVVDGLGLYMRPKYLNDEANAEQQQNTDYVLSQQLQGLKMSSKDQVGSGNTYIKRQSVPAAQPVE